MGGTFFFDEHLDVIVDRAAQYVEAGWCTTRIRSSTGSRR
ncbi:MAG: hypothetical protein QOF67_2350 [Mycobacterium sp.]|jgi:hypothetical protein|nr:hypothetical protein [Mycobacterium sp.]